MKGDGSVHSFPLNVVGPDSRPRQLTVEVYDQEAWDRFPEASKRGAYDDAMMYGKIEIVKRQLVAIIRRTGEARL